MIRPLARVLLVVLALAVSTSPAFAADPVGEPVAPTAGTGPTNEISLTADAPSGPTQVTHYECVPSDSTQSRAPTTDPVQVGTAEATDPGGPTGPGKVMCPNHFSLRPHTHIVGSLIDEYDGYYDYSTGRGCTGPCTLALSESQTWTHRFGFSIGFDKKPFSATVGYDVSFSDTRTFSYSFPVARGVTKVVNYKDWYHVSRYNIRTVWFSLLSSWTEYGTGWGGKWYQRIFYAKTV